MDLHRLKAFVAVAENGSYARAARTSGVAQSALSRQVSALERALGARVFHRTGRGVELTEVGERALPRARAIVSDASAFRDFANRPADELRGEVALGLVPAASFVLFGQLVSRLRAEHPGIRLRALEGYSGQVEEWLGAGQIEIGIYNRYSRGRVPNSEVLMREAMHLVVRSGHPLADQRDINLREIARIPLALPKRPNSLTGLLTALAASQRFEFQIALEASSSALTKQAVMLSDLGTISPPQVYREEVASGQLVALRIRRPDVLQTTWMSTCSGRPLSLAATAVLDIIRNLNRAATRKSD